MADLGLRPSKGIRDLARTADFYEVFVEQWINRQLRGGNFIAGI